MKIVTVSDSHGRDARKTRTMLIELGVPFATAKIENATVVVTNGDRVMAWAGYFPHLIRKHCPLGGL